MRRLFALSLLLTDLSQMLAHSGILSEDPSRPHEALGVIDVSTLEVNPSQGVPYQRELIGHLQAGIVSGDVIYRTLIKIIQRLFRVFLRYVQARPALG